LFESLGKPATTQGPAQNPNKVFLLPLGWPLVERAPPLLPSSANTQHAITFPSSPGLPILYLDPPLSSSSSAAPILVVLSVADHSIPVVVVFCSSFFNPCLKYEFPSLDQPHWGTLHASQITSNPLARTLLSGL